MGRLINMWRREIEAVMTKQEVQGHIELETQTHGCVRWK